jgi:apolipoprotein N-acyltransferase
MFAPMIVGLWFIDGAYGDNKNLSRRSMLSVALSGWWLGFGYFVASLWWLGAAMLVEADQFAWAMPFAVFGLPALLALFTASGFILALLLWSASCWRIFAFAIGISSAEWIRGHVLTGFPWNDVGMALAGAGPLAQTASLIGLEGLNLITPLLFATPALIFYTFPDHPKKNIYPLALSVTTLLAMASFGVFRLINHQTTYAPQVKLRLMQPNLAQDAKFRAENGPAILEHYLMLSTQGVPQAENELSSITHLIWPESAFPFILSEQPQALTEISQRLNGVILISGAARMQENNDGDKNEIYNAIEVVQRDRIIAAFDKKHLVPFGEYLPLEKLLQPLGINHLAPGVWDAGAGRRILMTPGLPPAAPLICYEAVFTGEVVEKADGLASAKWLLNVTNDGWFGLTIGPYQHFAQARLRAIEEGLPLIRVANTGISAIIDPYGRVLKALPLGVAGLIDGPLPNPASPPLFANVGGWAFAALWGVSLLLTRLA